MELEEIERKLKAPFRPEELEYRITAKTKDETKGLVAAYIQNRAVQNRLDEVVGFNNWKNEFLTVGDNSKICGISLRINGEWITKYDGAQDTNIESVKGGLSNSMKRAAVQWGIGRYLYDLPPQWVKIVHKGGKQFEISERPKLPNWALPEQLQHKQTGFDDKSVEEEKLPKAVEDCISAFKKFNITKSELETYLCLEADTFTDKDIETLRNIYFQLLKGKKKKEDFFMLPEKPKRGQQTLKLEQNLSGGKNG